MNIVDGLINAEFDFTAIGEWLKSVYETIAANVTVADLWDMLMSYVALVPVIAVSAGLVVLSLVEVFFGKKLLGLQKFLGCLAIGFAAGATYVPGLIPESIPVTPLVVGIVVGVVAALLFKLVYFLLYVGAAGYSVYAICMGGFYLPEAITAFTKGNMMISLVAAGVAVVVALLLKKLIEMVGTAALGAWFTWLSVVRLLSDFGLAFADNMIIKLVAIGVVALLGAIVQIKTRTRKW